MNALTPLLIATMPLSVGATTPTAPAGALAYSSTLSSLLQFNGSSWQALVGSGGGGGVTAVTATGNLASSGGTTPQITMLASPSFTNVTASGQFNGSGAGLTSGSVPNAALVSTPVDLTSAQTIGGIKTFSSPPVMSGASMTAGTLAPAALSTAPVLVSGAQTIAGIKTFSSPPVMSGVTISNSPATIAITASGSPGFYAGTGVPTFSAPNGSQYLRYDGTVAYTNTSGASTSGTAWTAASSGGASGPVVYNAAGTVQTAAKVVTGQLLLNVSNVNTGTVTLAGGAAFTSATSYTVTASVISSGQAGGYITTLVNNSGTSFTFNFNANATWIVNWVAVGS